MNYMDTLNRLKYDELPNWLAMQTSFDDDSPCKYITLVKIQRRVLYQAAFPLHGELVQLARTATLRHAKQLMWAYIVLNPPEGAAMTDIEMIEDINLMLGTAPIRNIYHDKLPVISVD